MFNHMQTGIMPLNANGEPIKLPENLESLPRADHFPTQRHRWNTNEEIAAILISFDKHSEWQSKEVKTRPKSGSLLLYSRKKVRYRRDGYCWKKRKDGKTTREDHMKLKVQGTECIYGCYVHSAILPTFHRRCYWLLQNPDIVLVHYLNVPYPDDNKMAVITPSLTLWGDKKEWTKEELVSQLKPMFFSEDEPDAGNEIEISTAETVEAIVAQLMEKQRLARQAALVKQLECGCPDSTCADGKSCSHPMRRINSVKSLAEKRQESNNQVSSTTPNVLIGPRLYSRWVDRRTRESIPDLNQKTMDNSIHFQVIPTLHNHSSLGNHHLSHHQQQQQQHLMARQNNAHLVHSSQTSQLLSGNSISTTSATSSMSSSSTNQHFTNATNASNQINRITNNNVSQMIINTSHTGNSLTGSAGLGLVTTLASNHQNNDGSQMTSHSNQQISLAISSDNNLNNLTNNGGTTHQQHRPHSQPQHHHHSTSHSSAGSSSSGGSGNNSHHHPRQEETHHQPSIIDSNVVNQRVSSNLISNASSGGRLTLSGCNTSDGGNSSNSTAPPLVLNLSQIQNSGGSLLILNGQQQSFVCQTNQQVQDRKYTIKDDRPAQPMTPNLVPKLEAMDSTSSSASEKQISDSVYDTISFSSMNQTTPSTDSPSKDSNSLTKELNDSLPFFNETLDLSQEDIQKTLSANMPLSANNGSNANDDGIDSDINPMDFIDNVCDVGVNSDPGVGSQGHDPDDVFVNLDAFDMLVEFPDLELETKNAFSQNTLDQLQNQSEANMNRNNVNQTTFNITDYSPEWAYPEGGVKVLVTGPWNTTSSYTVLFDSFPVPTTIVQTGVLRCYCPAHEVGFASLQVACDGYVISNSVVFEYKSPPNIETTCEGTANDSLYKFTLLNRLSSIDDRMQIKSEPKDSVEDVTLLAQANFEERLVNYCQALSNKMWRSLTPGSWPAGYRGMTLLHLAAALGYSKLVCTMLAWRAENPNVVLETEIDALSQDLQGFTPLAWACSRGHYDTASILYKWNYNSINIKNSLLQTPVEIARANGHLNIVSELERHERERINGQQQNRSSGTLSTFTTTTTTNTNNLNNSNNNLNSSYAYDVLSSNNIKDDNSSNNSTDNKNRLTGSQTMASHSNNSEEQQKQESLADCKIKNYGKSDQYSSSSPVRKVSSIQAYSSNDSGDNVNSKFENKDNEPNNNSTNNIANNESLLSQCSSPNSNGSMNSLGSSRSHDGVFLRPGAVSSGQSPPSMRLSKRPSVDSGINMDMRCTFTRSGKIFREQHIKHQSFDSNSDFTNSLDSTNMDGGSNSSAAGSLLSPLRKMDFALCEVSASESSPGQDKPSGPPSDDEDNMESNNLTDNSVVGESDAKVLTLAEHIIAAMPERIKNESEEMMSLGSPVSESLNTENAGMGGLSDTFMEPLLDSLANTQFDHEFNFEFSDHNYRYHDVGTPSSSLSPASSGPLQSPASYSIPPDPPMNSPSPPPSTQELTEFLQASNPLQRPFEADFSNLTLTDREQRELYEAAKCIQKAYRSYKGRKKLEEQDKERSAAIVIQNYYRRYKQFAYYKQMTHAAVVIQHGYRSYCENKRFKKSQNQPMASDNQDSQCLQDYYKNYQDEQQQTQHNTGSSSKEPSPSGPLKRTYSQRTQNQAARKIQQFMRQSKMKLQRERAEKERLVHQRRVEYLQSSQCPEQQEAARTQEQSEHHSEGN